MTPHSYIERPTCQGCGKPIAYGQRFLHNACVRVNESQMSETDLQVRSLYELYKEDPDQAVYADSVLLGIYTSFGAADAAANGKGVSGLKAFIKTVKGVVYNGKAYVLKHTVVSPVDICFADVEKQKKDDALSKLTSEERTLLGLDSDKS